MNLRLGTFCSGIGAPEQAAVGLPVTPVFTSEIEPFPCEVLKVRHPGTINLDDMTKLNDTEIPSVDVVFAGTPCQSFSVAGLRAGMADPRGNLALVLLGLVDRIRPRWLVWENVPGVLSVNGGRDFGSFLGALGQLGYGWAYRVLDAQYSGVPQRRRRVFVVGHLGDWRRAAAVLFERHSLSGNPPPRREAGQRIAAALTRGTDSSGKGGYAGRRQEDDYNIVPQVAGCLDRGTPGSRMRIDASDTTTIYTVRDRPRDDVIVNCEGHDGHLVPHIVGALSDGAHYGGGRTGKTHTPAELSLCLNAGGMGRLDYETETLIPTGGFFDDVSHSLRAEALGADVGMKQQNYLAYTITGTDKTDRVAFDTEVAGSIRTKAPGSIENSSTTVAADRYGVRRLTPTECERLQGFPDGYTDIQFRGKPAKDGPRYRALGNSMAVPVVRWILERLLMVDCLPATKGQ